MNCFKSALNAGSFRAKSNSYINSSQVIFAFNFLLLKSYSIQDFNTTQYKNLTQLFSSSQAHSENNMKFCGERSELQKFKHTKMILEKEGEE